MVSSAAAAADIYSVEGGQRVEPPANQTPLKSQPSPPVLAPNSDAKSRDKDRERRRAEKSTVRREGSELQQDQRGGRRSAHEDGIDPPAAMMAQEEPVHSLTAPNRQPPYSMTPPPLNGPEAEEGYERPRRQSQPNVMEPDAQGVGEPGTFDDDMAVRTAQMELLRRGHEVVGSDGKQQRTTNDRRHRRRNSSPDRGGMRGTTPGPSSATPRGDDAHAIQASIDQHAEQLRAELDGTDQPPLPRLGRDGRERSTSGGTGPFMTRDEHERRKKERATRLADMRQEASSQWRSSAKTDDPMGREWASRKAKDGTSRGGEQRNDRGGDQRNDSGGVSERGDRRRSGAVAR